MLASPLQTVLQDLLVLFFCLHEKTWVHKFEGREDGDQSEGSEMGEGALGHVVDADESCTILDRIEGGPVMHRGTFGGRLGKEWAKSTVMQ